MDNSPCGEEAVFHAARRLASPAERAEYLRGACGGDAALLARVQALLGADDQENSLAGVRLGPAADDGEAMPRPGSAVGRYRLLEQIGEGGFGTVFMAEQQHPVRRRVALKVIKPGMDTRQVIARFEAERQALALMDHPNIAKVLDAGATDTGRPYFVMELVKGVPITDYCDQNNLTPRQRLELFVQVCQAVQHAHQKGVIHRDLKPGNVLVTLHDARPVPKVIDFGIAKATGQQLTEKTLLTNFAQIVGTPLYMSPEQAALSGLDADTRSDVYSLGVLLYELLTGTTPFDKERLKKAALDEVRRIIREEQPPKPSTRIGTLGQTLPTVSSHRATESRKLGPLMRGELDCIVMKALEKDRTRRYETANGLAMDVRRYLDNEPVSARPASAAYRLRKFASKHKVGFAAAAAVAAALVLGIIGTSAGLVRARRQADRATAVSAFLQSVLASARPDVMGGGKDAKVVDLLQRAESMIETDLADQPGAQAQTYYTLFFTYMSLGLVPESRANLNRAHAAIQKSRMEDTELGVRIAIHKSRHDFLTSVAPVRCEQIARGAVERAQRLFGEEHEITLFARGVLAQPCLAMGKTNEADDNFRRLAAGASRLGSPRLASPGVAATLADYAGVLQTRGEFARSEAVYREALRLGSAARHRIFLMETRAWEGLAQALGSQERWSEVAEVYERARADLRPHLGEFELQAMSVEHAQVLRRLGRGEEAARVQRRLMASLNAVADAPAHTHAALARRAELRVRVGRFKESVDDFAGVMELDPKSHWAGYFRGCALAYVGDEAAYRAHCAAMLERFGGRGSPDRDAERIAKMCLLLPGVPDVERLNAVMDHYLGVDTGVELAWDQLVKAMVEYRACRFEACIRWAGEATAGLRDTNRAGKATAELFAAMAHHRLGRNEQARRMLNEVVRWAEQELGKPGVDGISPRHTIDDWFNVHVALREAESLIHGKPPAGAPQNE